MYNYIFLVIGCLCAGMYIACQVRKSVPKLFLSMVVILSLSVYLGHLISNTSAFEINRSKSMVYLQNTWGDSFQIDSSYDKKDIVRFFSSGREYYIHLSDSGLYTVMEYKVSP